ncbi:MAG TPA: GIY-YIG nuclease family protein [Anaerolineales bacterium]|nr:GIY-YIG nuclease family protein [Anaerolineales bacterium]
MAWMYILQCADDSYYVDSTKNLEFRLAQHQEGKGARYTARRLPVKLVYSEEYERVVDAFNREKQVQNWSRAKREALIKGTPELLPALAKKKFEKKIEVDVGRASFRASRDVGLSDSEVRAETNSDMETPNNISNTLVE